MAGQGGSFVRREVWSLAPEDPVITAYARAVAHMRERAASDPTSWSYQAAMHGSEVTPTRPLWNQCQHRSWYFLPWHRMFLYHFEQIVRAAVIATGGPTDWALPYWNYGLGGRNATLPLPFRKPTLADGSVNPLYVEARAPGINSGATLPAAATSPAPALARPHFIGAAEFGGGATAPAQFSTAGGKLEETPHNAIHVLVGGETGIMGNILTAAQDPIFWLHHANIDRIWSLWTATAGHGDPPEPRWRNQSFAFFDQSGQQVSMHCADVLETLADLGYTYDTTIPPTASPAPSPAPPSSSPPAAVSPPGPPAMQVPEPQLVGASEQSLELVGAPASISIPIDGEAASEPIAANQHVYLNVEDIEGESNPGTVYGVYANLPAGAPPDLEAAHHVGNVSFFGIERAQNPQGDEPAHNLRVAADITGLARELEARGEWVGHTLVVTFRPLTLVPPEVPDEHDPVRPPTGKDTPIRIGRVSIFYDA
jgi:tyrosinase